MTLKNKVPLPSVLAEKIIQLKNPCLHCAKPISFKVDKELLLVEFSNTESPDLKEGIFGSILPPEKDFYDQLSNFVLMLKQNAEKLVEAPTTRLWDRIKQLFI
jgi:hypothetical protein